MKNTNKVVLLSIIGFLLMGSYLTLATAQTPFKFRNQFQFQIRTNNTVDLVMDVDVDAVGAREFQLELNTTERVELTIRINASDESRGLEDGGNKVQAQNQNRYRYQEQFQVNLECDGDVQAKLQIKTSDSQAQWAYYDENQAEWVTVESSYQDGVLTTETDHFSTWTVLTPDESIPSYPLIGLVSIGSIVGLLFIIKKKK